MKKTTVVLGLLLGVFGSLPSLAQPPEAVDAAELKLRLKRLTVVGGALYVAAHPDDESTALLAYWSRGRLVRSAYLSMTRGDGGQNLIGTEKGELMGLIRTQELLAARRVDGARQFFTRAVDFGFSKNPEETLRIWGKEPVLSDVVWVIRKFRPDVIVTRFPVTGEGGHGHHTASAILAEEAFDAAGDPTRFPEQLKGPDAVKVWKPKRLLWNVFRWDPKKRDLKEGDVSVDLGTFNPLAGRSYMEIAGISRSMHKSQGFGAQELRGSWENDFRLRKGDAPSKEMFDGVDLSWRRIKGGERVAPILDEAVRAYDDEKPSAVVPILLRAYAEMEKLGDDPDVAEKKAELVGVVRAAAGLHIEAIAKDFSVTPGKDLEVTLAAVNRSPLSLTLDSVAVTHQEGAIVKGDETFPTPLLETGGALPFNIRKTGKVTLRIPKDAEISNPYWLKERPGQGLFHVTERSTIGLPELPEPLTATFGMNVAGTPIAFTVPVQYRWTDPVRGDLYRPIEVAPPVTVNFEEKVNLFGSSAPRHVRLTIAAEEPKAKGRLRLRVPPGWKAMPADVPFAFTAKGEEATIDVTIAPPAKAESATLGMDVTMDGGESRPARGVVRIDYPHIPIQTLFPPAETRLVRLDVKTLPSEIGYVMGSGDEVPATLKQLGYKVTLLSDDDLASLDLSRFPVIVLGVRAYNTRERLKALQPRLMAYVENGGTLVDQYVTTSELLVEHFGPYPFTIGRDRVTVEEAPMTFLSPAHPLLHVPNEISPADFQGWLQERGLYFATKWDDKYETVLSSHDPGEPDKAGGLLYAKYGKGTFIYTGLAFFRQLPAGVPGATRLFVNLISAGRASTAPLATAARQ